MSEIDETFYSAYMPRRMSDEGLVFLRQALRKKRRNCSSSFVIYHETLTGKEEAAIRLNGPQPVHVCVEVSRWRRTVRSSVHVRRRTASMRGSHSLSNDLSGRSFPEGASERAFVTRMSKDIRAAIGWMRWYKAAPTKDIQEVIGWTRWYETTPEAERE